MLSLLLLALCALWHGADLSTSAASNRLTLVRSPDRLANLCLTGKNHKADPGPEPALSTGPCAAYAGRACCTAEVGNQLGADDEFANAAFRLDHCGQKLSPECARWFERSRCMYECSPHLGPWLVKVSGFRWRTERVYNLPLCRSQCQAWYAACSRDLSCVPNWSTDFVWRRVNNTAPAVNRCPAGAACRPLAELHAGSADQFCETVWDGEYDVVSDTLPCLELNWTAGRPNPNGELAALASREKLAFLTAHAPAPAASAALTALPALALVAFGSRG